MPRVGWDGAGPDVSQPPAQAWPGLLPRACRLHPPPVLSLCLALHVCAQVPIPVWNDLKDGQEAMSVATQIDHLPLDDKIDLGFEYLADYV